MRRSLAALAAASMIATSLPSLGFAEETGESSDTSGSTASSASVSSKPARPCDDLTGLRKAQCIRENRKEKKPKKTGIRGRAERTIDKLSRRCDERGVDVRACIHRLTRSTEIRKAIKAETRRTIRGKLLDRRQQKAADEIESPTEDGEGE